jgi:hypothetical protein
MSLTKLSLAGNNFIIPGQGELSRLGTGKSITFFTVYRYVFFMEINYKYGIISADRAKQIKTKAIVNEDPTEALIRELRQALPSFTRDSNPI